MQEIAAPDIIDRIRAENPWWGGQHGISELHSAMKPRAYLKQFMRLLNEESVRRGIVLMGPRRIGKTVMIHHAIQNLIDEGVPPQAICYISVDHPIYNGLGLDALLEYYGQSSGVNYRIDPVYVFFDEIQYLRNWEVHLKSVVDSYPAVRSVASGSAAAALRLKSLESGAGRFTDFLLPPLTFYEYLNLLDLNDLVDPPLPEKPREQGGGWFRPKDIGTLNDQFLKYLNFGGYPEVIFSKVIQSDPGRYIKSDIIDKVLLRDLPSLYGISDIQELNYLFTTLAYNTATEISLGELSQNSGVAKNTIKRYIDYLEAAFLIKVVHRVDRNAKRFRRANYFKVYLTNPSMRAALFSPIAFSDKAIGPLTETAIFSQWFHSISTILHYARWSDGEVDLVAIGTLNQKANWAVEVKWSDRYCDHLDELDNVIDFCKSNNLQRAIVTSATRNCIVKWQDLFIEFVPASVYCYTVGYNVVHSKRPLKQPNQAIEELESSDQNS